MSSTISTELLQISQSVSVHVMEKLITIASEVDAIIRQNKRLSGKTIYKPSAEELQMQKDKIDFLKKNDPKQHILYINELQAEYDIMVNEYDQIVRLYNITYDEDKKREYEHKLDVIIDMLNNKKKEIRSRISNQELYDKLKKNEAQITRKNIRLSDNLSDHYIIDELTKIAMYSRNSLKSHLISIINRLNPILKKNISLKERNYLKYIQTLEGNYRPTQREIQEKLRNLKDFAYGFF